MKKVKVAASNSVHCVTKAHGGLYVPPLKSNAAVVEYVEIASLIFPARELRARSPETEALLTASVKKFGILSPPLVSATNEVIVGRARIEAARRAGERLVPVIRHSHLTPAEIRLFRLADNKLVERGEWTSELAWELQELSVLGLDLDRTGFSTPEIDIEISGLGDAEDDAFVEEIPEKFTPGAEAGDLLILGNHRLLCGNCLDAALYPALMGGAQARMMLTDPPYNLRVQHVSGLGRAQHAEFAMASGELTEDQFTDFLTGFLTVNLAHLVDGALSYVFIGWGQTFELGAAQRRARLQLLNICTWTKTNGGMGSFYRSATEFCFVMKHGSAPHSNNVMLGKYGRYRTNSWLYAGANTFRKGRDEDLAAHPTVKPLALFADAILDASKRGEIVIDPFGGSGTTILAAERTGRHARVIEIDPGYVGVAIMRWQKMTGRKAVLAATGETFDEVVARRARQPEHSQAVRQRTRSIPVTPSDMGG